MSKLVAVHWPMMPMSSLNISPCLAVASADSFCWMCIRITLDWIIYTQLGCIVMLRVHLHKSTWLHSSQAALVIWTGSDTAHVEGLRQMACAKDLTWHFPKSKQKKTLTLWPPYVQMGMFACVHMRHVLRPMLIDRSNNCNAQTKHTSGNLVLVCEMPQPVTFKN